MTDLRTAAQMALDALDTSAGLYQGAGMIEYDILQAIAIVGVIVIPAICLWEGL